MTKNTLEWRIHIGAHKTASTHLQDVLEICRPELLKQGIDYLPRNIIRPRLRKILPKHSWRFFLRNWSRQIGLAHRLAPHRENLKAIVFSDEVIMGNIPSKLLDEIPYPELQDRLGFVRKLSRNDPVRLFLSVRSFDRVLPGAYATELVSNPDAPLLLQSCKAALERRSPSWVEIIERIMAAVPDVPLRVWRQEDYRENTQIILSEFVGCRIDPVPDIPPPPNTITPSATAISTVEALLRSKEYRKQSYPQKVMEIYAAYPATGNNDRYNFLTPRQSEKLRKQYEQDLEEISHRWPGMVIGS